MIRWTKFPLALLKAASPSWVITIFALPLSPTFVWTIWMHNGQTWGQIFLKSVPRSGAHKLWPMHQILLISSFVNRILLQHDQAHLFIYCTFCASVAELSSCTRTVWPMSLKYPQTGPLQKNLADLCSGSVALNKSFNLSEPQFSYLQKVL